MKKFFITLVILIVLGGAGFFFGWVQFHVPAGKYGVISSKTHGIDPKLARSGEFRWIWYMLLPTNVKISVFNPEYAKFNLQFNSDLPSGKTYASFAGLSTADFSWDLNGEIAFNINPDHLVRLTALNNLSGQEDLNALMERTAKDIEIIIMRSLSTISSADDSTRIEKIMTGNGDAQMEKEIKTAFPEIDEFLFTIQTVKFPDFVLYRQLRLLYEEFLVSQREYVTSTFRKMAENHINIQLKLSELEQYGELLTKYPILLEYIQLESGNQ